MKCPKCGSENPASATVCQCGEILSEGGVGLQTSLAQQAQEIRKDAHTPTVDSNVQTEVGKDPKDARKITASGIVLFGLFLGFSDLGIASLSQIGIPGVNPWTIVIGAVITRIVVLPFTIKTERYFALLRTLFTTMDTRVNVLRSKFADDPEKAYAEEVYSIEESLHHNQNNKKPFLFIIPILIQTSILVVVWLNFWGAQHDPYYVLPFLFLTSIVIKHRVFLPYKKKGLLYLLDFILAFFLLSFSAGGLLFVTSLLILSALQSFVLNSQSKPLLIANDNNTPSLSEEFDFDEWLLTFKKKGSLFALDDVVLSLFLSLVAIPSLFFYIVYFYLRRRGQWGS